MFYNNQCFSANMQKMHYNMQNMQNLSIKNQNTKYALPTSSLRLMPPAFQCSTVDFACDSKGPHLPGRAPPWAVTDDLMGATQA